MKKHARRQSKAAARRRGGVAAVAMLLDDPQTGMKGIRSIDNITEVWRPSFDEAWPLYIRSMVARELKAQEDEDAVQAAEEPAVVEV